MNPGLLMRQHYQTAYVTTDRDGAIDHFSQAYGVANWYRPDRFELKTLEGETYWLKVAHAFVGDTNIELIQPDGGADDLYSFLLPRDRFAIRFHHYATRIRDEAEWLAARAASEAAGLRIAWEGSAVGTHVFYLDTFAELGHYLEYLWFYDIEKSSFPRIPHN